MGYRNTAIIRGADTSQEAVEVRMCELMKTREYHGPEELARITAQDFYDDDPTLVWDSIFGKCLDVANEILREEDE